MVALHHVRTGPRDRNYPILLLHSAGLDLTYWDAQISALGRDHDVIAVDLPGHGFSAAPGDLLTIESMAAAVSETIASLGPSPVDLVGLSVGGLIAQQIALTRPAQARSMILIDTAARFAPTGQAAMRERAATLRHRGTRAILGGLFSHWFTPHTFERRPDLVDRATKTVIRNAPEVQASLWEAIASYDAIDRLGAIDVPTLVLVGEHDSSSPVSAAKELCDAIPGAQLAVIADAAHLSTIDQPDVVSTHIDAFIRTAHPGMTR